MRRLLALAGLVMWLTAPASAGAVSVTGWSLTAIPSTVTSGVVIDVLQRLTDTDGSGDIGCMRMDVPAAFVVVSVGVTGTNAATPWAAAKSGAGPTSIEVYNPGGGGKLGGGEWVDFRVTVRGVPPGTYSWVAEVVQNDDCTGSTFLAPISLAMTIAAPAPTSTPTFTPTPSATPASTPQPTASPQATPSNSGATPATPTGTPNGSLHPSAIPEATSSPVAEETPGPDGAGGESPTSGPAIGNPDQAGTAPDPAAQDGSSILPFEAMGLLGDFYSWFVPGLVVGVPGLLLILLIGLNLGLGAAWVPNVGRLLGEAPPDPPTEEHLWWATGGPLLD